MHTATINPLPPLPFPFKIKKIVFKHLQIKLNTKKNCITYANRHSNLFSASQLNILVICFSSCIIIVSFYMPVIKAVLFIKQ